MTPYPLAEVDDATFWPWFSWPKFAAWPAKDTAVVVVPVAGFSGAADLPLDHEETALMDGLRGASKALGSPPWLLVLPPIRFVVGPAKDCAFAVNPPTAHRLLAEVVNSIAAAGFRKILYGNASPWNEEICAASARDLHVEKDLDMFILNTAKLETAKVAELLKELHEWKRPPAPQRISV